MVVPLRARGRGIGALSVVSLDPSRRYEAADLALAEDLARRAALSLDNARLHEGQTTIARTLQFGMLPGRLPELPGVDLAARFRPGGDGMVIGGDFYDVLPRPDGFDLVIGDVTGKGAGAVALTGVARHTLRTAARYEDRPSAVLRAVNEAILADQGSERRYCTVALCRVTLGAAPRAVVCIAGHPHPLVLRAGGEVEPVGESGALLGWVPDPHLTDSEVALAGDETLLLYTDGLSEAPAGDARFGDARVAEVMKGAAGESAGTLARRLQTAAFGDEQPRDDLALLVARLVPSG
jgi:serine phosphatase RsbU (regulator of sigma subunit)